MNVNEIVTNLERKHHGEDEYLQAVREVLESIKDVYEDTPKFYSEKIIERLVEPDRVFTFKIPWINDKGEVEVNLGYRVQFNNALGPYKGGLRFHPSVNLSSLKFLGFEQIFKNALTTLPLGGGKGGSDFTPKGKSDQEIMRFCQSFMLELWRVIGAETDVPAGDIGVGGREIGYLYGMYKKLARKNTGVLTGKGIHWGGSLIRPEATGFGVIYFVRDMLAVRNDSLEGKKIALSGFGNVAWGAALKANELGAKIVTISGPDGYIYDEDGIYGEKIDYMQELRTSNDDVVAPYADKYKAQFFPEKRPWEQDVDIAIPCAIQNELNEEDAMELVNNNVILVAEASNMGCTHDAIEVFHEQGVPFAPGKAANAGGVAVSGLEMSQNSMKLSWSREEVDNQLNRIMANIHAACVRHGQDETGHVNYQKGANIAGFLKVADAMTEHGVL